MVGEVFRVHSQRWLDQNAEFDIPAPAATAASAAAAANDSWRTLSMACLARFRSSSITAEAEFRPCHRAVAASAISPATRHLAAVVCLAASMAAQHL
jgi:hypothetical protein